MFEDGRFRLDQVRQCFGEGRSGIDGIGNPVQWTRSAGSPFGVKLGQCALATQLEEPTQTPVRKTESENPTLELKVW